MRENGLRVVSTAGQLLLLLMGLAWAVLERPAPVVTVRWRDGLTEPARLQAARQLQLENAQPSEDAWQYEIWNPRQPYIAAIVAHPDVLDTSHIDRVRAAITADAGRGRVRVWWRGPFAGAAGRWWYRVLFAIVGAATLAATLLERRK